MAIPIEQKPNGCSCDWEEVATFSDADPVIERTMMDPECPVHTDKG